MYKQFYPLFEKLSTDSLILTANNRLNRNLKEAYYYYYRKKCNAWESLNSLPLQTWLKTFWETLVETGLSDPLILLSDYQENILWQKIIRANTRNCLLNIKKTSYYAQQAWKLLQQYRIPLTDSRLASTDDSKTFIHWAKQFQNECEQKKSTSTNCLSNIISKHLNKYPKTNLPKQIIFIGFLELTPNIELLINNLKNKRIHCDTFMPTNQTSFSKHITLESEDMEILTAAIWAKNYIAKHNGSTVACVMPNLAKKYVKIHRIFDEVFGENKIYNISSGQAIIHEPIINQAINLLRLVNNSEEFPTSMLSNILRSPYFYKGETHHGIYALLDKKIHQLYNSSYQFEFLIKLLQNNFGDFEKQLAKILEKSKEKNTINKAKIETWVEIFSQQLAILSWPGQRNLNSREYQATQHWIKLLKKLTNLDLILDSVTANQAINYLESLCQQTLFQPETLKYQVQILGLLEAIGLPFHAMWISNMSDMNFPQPPNPNPLLPNWLQRQLDMPHSSSKRELQFAENLLQTFSESSDKIIFSYPAQIEDREQRISPLIKDSLETTLNDLELKIISEQNKTNCLENLADKKTPIANGQIHGGTNILKYQADCPFKAFAKLRLNAEGIPSTSIGLTYLERGLIIHTALEFFWEEVGTKTALCKLSKNKLNDILNRITSKAIFKHTTKRNLTKSILSVEKTRIIELLENFMELEKQRDNFSVTHCEHTQHCNFAGINFKFRIDRIDKLDDGNYSLIDYKTGITNTNDWTDNPIKEPQLPFYTITSNLPIIGISFAQLRTGQLYFKSLTTKENIFPSTGNKILANSDSANSWKIQLDIWKNQLTQLAQDFSRGKADVNPRDKKTCQQCDLHMLCRIGFVS